MLFHPTLSGSWRFSPGILGCTCCVSTDEPSSNAQEQFNIVLEKPSMCPIALLMSTQKDLELSTWSSFSAPHDYVLPCMLWLCQTVLGTGEIAQWLKVPILPKAHIRRFKTNFKSLTFNTCFLDFMGTCLSFLNMRVYLSVFSVKRIECC